MAFGFSKLPLFNNSVLLLLLATLASAAVDPIFQARCARSAVNYTANSTYEVNLNSIFSQLTSLTVFNEGFYNLSAGANPNRVNAIALCRGDMNQTECNSCLKDTVSELKQRCPLSKEVVGWSEFCMVRYANRDIYGEVEVSPDACLLNVKDVNASQYYTEVLADMFTTLSSEAAAGDHLRKYAADKSTVGAYQEVYLMLQCTPDLSEKECADCLAEVKAAIGGCCLGKMGCRVLKPSCFSRFESVQFYQTPVPLPSSPPSPHPPPPPPSSTGGKTYLLHAFTI